MTTFLLALLVVVAAFVGMAIGVLLSNRRLKGTCGGLGNLRDDQGRTLCDACDNPSPTCRGEPLERKSEDDDAEPPRTSPPTPQQLNRE